MIASVASCEPWLKSCTSSNHHISTHSCNCQWVHWHDDKPCTARRRRLFFLLMVPSPSFPFLYSPPQARSSHLQAERFLESQWHGLQHEHCPGSWLHLAHQVLKVAGPETEYSTISIGKASCRYNWQATWTTWPRTVQIFLATLNTLSTDSNGSAMPV